MATPNGLKILAGSYLHGIDLAPIDKAWELVLKVHGDKVHFSGEPYVDHALEVASTLASMHMDLDTVVAGLLHGTLKDGVKLADLRHDFGSAVAEIVDGSTRITNVQYNNRLAHQAENVRKMLLAIAADIRVLLVKLADRLQDMCTLEAVPLDQQKNVARETMDLYAPLAGRLGIDWLKRELEDLSFRFLHPDEFAELSAKLESSLGERQRYVDEVLAIFNQKLAESHILPTRIFGRPKHLYSIYKKLLVQKISLDKVYDKVAFRIIVHSVKDCYEALGVVHANWAPVQGRIKDFVSVPKGNNYQSLHTTVVGPRGQFIEIQIRTEQMDRVAQEGVAAHWAYKEGQGVNVSDAKLFKELKKLVKTLQEVEDPREFLDSVRGELYEPEVYALTPGGEVKEFPLGSCPVDFAYSVHTAVGDHCAGAKVNGRLVPLKYELQNGDIVEIVTSKNQRPRRGWLAFLKTTRARSRVRSWLRREENEKALNLGREICDRELKNHHTTLKKMVKSGHIKLLLKELRSNSLDDLLTKVGAGVITLQHLVKALQPIEMRGVQEQPSELTSEELAGLKRDDHGGAATKAPSAVISIDGIDDMLIKLSQCCNPVPGDAIVGFITTGRGISIHKAECPNLLTTDPQRWMDVAWAETDRGQYRAELQVTAENRRGTIAAISSVVSADDANIVEISARTTLADTVEIRIVLEVANLKHLQKVLTHLRQEEHVISVRRS
ncbi:MAG: bifunctional (p)ppGpp synthetase/guanosine-3',5'-bis(diphosphate) 3'-pyrophosphohydrolase [Desulfobulbaceae bacterium]|uniref:Bifunctional (P)ppGpp synthetase/guanosine-3',5'-bis(Diphosphate) 3'-pyrophosphohydrolase n=1 Tax=Candidatus Desulfatifera sulfidica TaxID=2841691 RepID=A0A8J6N7L2_9BACT|nr:bifunctional (p)ppGpp synthetase/guanosine-3',5'-bis(diphosphate) 3'-pyrophosphohydrolase [Candidatus Desulfatifera sulfidica]